MVYCLLKAEASAFALWIARFLNLMATLGGVFTALPSKRLIVFQIRVLGVVLSRDVANSLHRLRFSFRMRCSMLRFRSAIIRWSSAVR